MATLALAGCASPRDPDLRLPAAFEAPAGASAAAPPPGALALDTWWTAYNDAELTALIEQALARNPDIRTARSRLDEVKAQRTGSILQYLPQGDATLQGRRTDTDQIGGTAANIPGFSTAGVSKQYQSAFTVNWEVDPWGRGFVAYRAANAEVDRVRYAYEVARAQLAAETADSWFEAKGLAIQLADARETTRIQQDLYEIASKRAERGLAAGTEPDRIAGDLSQARAQVAALEAQLQVQKRAILILAGRIVEPTANINATPEVGQAPAVPQVLPSELLQRRADISGRKWHRLPPVRL